MEQKKHWISCDTCKGRGKTSGKLKKKVRLNYQLECEKYAQSEGALVRPVRPKASLQTCIVCDGTGIVPTAAVPVANTDKYPHVAIIGGGIAGVALALACLHRQIPFTLFERDKSFHDRSQGYGLTLQQANRIMKKLGLMQLDEGIVSTKHIVHTTEGEVIGEWGMRKWVHEESKKTPKRTNMHIARQALREAMITQLGNDAIQWGHQFIGFTNTTEGIELTFDVGGLEQKTTSHIVVGADGIRSAVRKCIIPEESSPLQYLGCIVILGICELNALKDIKSHLLDGETVFQTVNGIERIYVMPYSHDKIMWQLSFPMDESAARQLSSDGPQALKMEALRKTQWHVPIPQIIAATEISAISGYPVYDRAMLALSLFQDANAMTLIGDAAHPMSPFKGQGANQALLDALLLAQQIVAVCNTSNSWQNIDLRQDILAPFEIEMVDRSSLKVKGSAAAAQSLHSDIVLQEGNETIGAKWRTSLKDNKKGH